MKRVLIVIGKLYIGGAEKVGRDIGYYADKTKYEIHYLVFGDEVGPLEAELVKAGCIIHHMAPPSSGYIKYYINLRKLLIDNNIDIIHSHTMFNSGWIMLIGKQLGISVRISHSHSIKGPEHRGLLKNIYENVMRRLILRYSTKLVACGNGAGNWLYGEKEFQRRGTVIYNGIGLEEFVFSQEKRSTIRKKYNLEDKFIIGHVGHLAAVKNQIFIIEKMPYILKQNPNAVFLMLGDGQDKSILQERAKELKIEDKLIFTGNVNNVGDYMSAMDVFVFPSLYEGMPLALVEAQTNGLPCIISNNIPKDVYLTDLIKAFSLEDSNEEWIQQILKAKRKNPDLYGQEMFDIGFDTSEMVKKIYALYEEQN